MVSELETLVETLRSEVKREARLAVLFGSRARGEAGPESDVDVAFVPRVESMSLTEESRLQADLERVLGRPVDLVRLDRADLTLRWRIARDGVLIWSETPVGFSRFRARTASEYADFAPAQRVAARRYRRRLLAGSDGPGERSSEG